MRMSRRMGVYSSRMSPVYLYDSGTENTSVTGGLTAYDYIPSTSGSARSKPTISRGTSAMTISLSGNGGGSGGTVYTSSKVDLTRAKTMNIKVSSISVQNGGYVRFGATATKSTGYTVAAAKTITSTGVLSLDVSALKGSYYLIIATYGAYDKSVKFTEWWIE